MSSAEKDRKIKQLTTKIQILRQQNREDRKKLRLLTEQYEAVIIEMREFIKDMFRHSPKLFLLYLANKWNRFRGRGTKLDLGN